jgi:hypothetical protein
LHLACSGKGRREPALHQTAVPHAMRHAAGPLCCVTQLLPLQAHAQAAPPPSAAPLPAPPGQQEMLQALLAVAAAPAQYAAPPTGVTLID